MVWHHFQNLGDSVLIRGRDYWVGIRLAEVNRRPLSAKLVGTSTSSGRSEHYVSQNKAAFVDDIRIYISPNSPKDLEGLLLKYRVPQEYEIVICDQSSQPL